MKKKFLSLMMAATVVATTSVSAFAAETISTTPTDATGEKKLTVSSDGEGQETDINIIGNIANNDNKVLPSTISVTVPTSAQFTVTKDGDLVGSNIKITNEGSETVSVIAQKFIDTSGATGINVVSESEVASASATESDRKKVSLKLAGNLDTVNLKTTATGKGLFKTDGNDVGDDEDFVVGNVRGNDSTTFSLSGTAVKSGNALTNPINDKFTLILKIKKEDKKRG